MNLQKIRAHTIRLLHRVYAAWQPDSMKALSLGYPQAFLNFPGNVMLAELHTLKDSIVYFTGLGTAVGLYHQTFYAQERSSTVLRGVKGF